MNHYLQEFLRLIISNLLLFKTIIFYLEHNIGKRLNLHAVYDLLPEKQEKKLYVAQLNR